MLILLLAFFLLTELGAGLLKCLIQRLFVNRFEKIVHNTLLDCSFCVFEMPVAARNDKLRRKPKLLHLLNKLQSVAARHPDIRQNDIWFVLLNAFERTEPVIAHVGDLKAERIPVPELNEELCNAVFILHNNHAKRHFLPPCTNLIQISLMSIQSQSLFAGFVTHLHL